MPVAVPDASCRRRFGQRILQLVNTFEISLLPSQESEAYLLATLQSAPELVAEHAVHALAVHRHRDEIVDAVRAAVGKRKSARLRRAVELAFEVRS